MTLCLALFLILEISHFKNSTLLLKLNQGDFLGASDQFLKWQCAKGKPLKGLLRR
jgi:lysozyme